MWSQQCYTGFDTDAIYYSHLQLHSGKFNPIILFYFIFFVNVTLVIFTKLLSSSFGPQNSTTNKYHLSGVTLLANWSDSGKYLL